MNLSWFDDWRFDLRRRAAFHQTTWSPGRQSKDYKGAVRTAARQNTSALVDWHFVFVESFLCPFPLCA
jgi:hypothetical protein